jgi:spore coat polysaccharide biosynthesis protein SpsF
MSYKQKKTLGIILCRNNSSRLKNKLKLKIGKKTCFEFFFERLIKCKKIDEYIIATTKSKNDNYFFKFAKKNNIKIFRGSENNVLSRMVGAYRSLGKDYEIIVRCNSDNTLIMPHLIDLDIKNFLKSESDFFSPFNKNKIPFGYSLTLFKSKKLIEISKKKLDKKYKEHIDNYFLENPKKFKIYENYLKKFFCPNLFLTLDTKFDYKRIKFYEEKIRNIPLKNQAIKIINIFKKQI